MRASPVAALAVAVFCCAGPVRTAASANGVTAPAVARSPSPAAAAAPAATAAAAVEGDPCAGPASLLATLNRPTIGYSACAVQDGALVLEEGYQNTYAGGANGSVTAAYPQGFERFGVAPRVELDLIGPSYNGSRAGALATTGYSDLGLGFKYELPQAGRFIYAIDGLYTAATGSGGFSNGGPTETLNVDVSYALSPAIGVGTTLAGSSTASAVPFTARYGTFDPSLVVTAQIPNYYQFYAEIVGLTKIAPQGGGRVYTDFGLQKLIGRNLELDAEYGIDLTPVAGSRFDYVGAGFGLRVK